VVKSNKECGCADNPAWAGRAAKARTMPEVLCLGEALVDLISEAPGKAIADASCFQVRPGGAVCNVTVGLARLGVKVGLVTKVGTDPFGRLMLNFLKREKVDTALVKTTDRRLTALVFIALDKDRKPSFFFYGAPGADRGLKPSELSAKNFARVKVFHFGTISLSREPARAATLKAIRLAKASGARVSMDPNFRFHLWRDRGALKKITWSLLPGVDMVKLNEQELAFLTGTKSIPGAAQMLINRGVKVVVVTLGGRGAFFAAPGFSGVAPGFKFRPVDTTGAGDAFAAAMIAWLLRFKELPPEKDGLEKAVRFANAFAGLSITRIGAVDGLFSWNKVEQFLAASSRS